MPGSEPAPNRVRGVSLADTNFFDPRRRVAPEEFLSALVKKEEAYMLGLMDGPEILTCSLCSTDVVGLNSVAEVLSLAGLHT